LPFWTLTPLAKGLWAPIEISNQIIAYSASLAAETEHVWLQQRSQTMHRRKKDNTGALDAFLAKKAEIGIMLARLTALDQEPRQIG